MTKSIILGSDNLPVIPQQAIQAKASAIEKAKAITTVTAENIEEAIARIGVLKGLCKGVEETRMELRKPFSDAIDSLMAASKEYRKGIEEESTRLEKLCTAFKAEEQRKIDAELRKQREEQQRIKDEEERLEREKQEAQRKLEEAKTKKQKAEAAAELAKVEAKRDDLEFSKEEPVPLPEVASTSGASVRSDETTVEVYSTQELMLFIAKLWIDSDRSEAAANRCKFGMEMLDLKPKNKAIKDFITFHNGGKTVPGVTISTGLKMSFRAQNPRTALNG